MTYELRFKDIDPDTGDISQEKAIAKIECDEKTKDYIVHSLNATDDAIPNREYYAVEK